MKRAEREQIARELISAAETIFERQGSLTQLRIKGDSRQVVHAQVEDLELLEVTPFARLPGAPGFHGVDIWIAGKGKVFSAWWEPLEVITFKQGAWAAALLAAARTW